MVMVTVSEYCQSKKSGFDQNFVFLLIIRKQIYLPNMIKKWFYLLTL